MNGQKSLPDDIHALASIIQLLDPLAGEQRQFVVDSVIAKFRLSRGAATKVSAGDGVAVGGVGANPEEMTPKEFLREKRPKSDVERMACLGYYLAKYRQTEQFKTRDLSALAVEAALPKISNPSMAMDNATKNNGYFAPVGGGKKQLTALGESVVEALPDKEAVQEAVAEYGKVRRRTRRKKFPDRGES